jgi:hypothetical protein
MADDTAGDSQRRERRREIERKYKEKNRDKINKYRRDWRLANRDRLNERRRARRAEPEYHARERERRRQERAAHPEKYRERTRKWRAENPEKYREMYRRHNQLADQLARIHGPDWRLDYAAFWEAQDGCCYLCGNELHEEVLRGIAIDHDHRCCPKKRSCKICRRGLACRRCNTTIGLFDDNPAVLRRVADALEVALAVIGERLKSRAEQGELF